MLPKAKFLTVVWGKTYIERFCSLSLPSFLAPGNIPAVAQATDLEVVIMTRRRDFEQFQKNVTFKRLTAVCPVRFVEIDDLIASAVYGVTLTLAYARPIIACGEDMLSTYFVFMNADFVLANGSLLGLCSHISAGRSIVLAPSFRATAEDLEPRLKASVNAFTGILDIAPRRLVGLSLASPHRTTVAKIVDQKVLHSTHPNQFFWQVDESTVLARYFLIFMLCLKPERVIKNVNCYCDYSFIPELCPSGDEVVMNDSDKFFMLELQSREQETHMLRFGEVSIDRIARSLSYWTTAEHRRAADHEVVFHSRDISPKIGAVRAAAQEFIDDVKRRLDRPKSHVNHRYWVMGVEAWKSYRTARQAALQIPELAPYRVSLPIWLRLARNRAARQFKEFTATVRRLIWGSFSARSLLNPNWADYRLLGETIRDIVAGVGSDQVLVVGERDQLIDSLLLSHPEVVMITPRDLARSETVSTIRHRKKRYANVLLYVKSANFEYLLRLFERCVSVSETNGLFSIFVKPEPTASRYSDVSRLLLGLGDMFGNRAQSWSMRSAGSLVGDLSRRISSRVATTFGRQSARYGNWAMLWTLPPAMAAHLLAFAGNVSLRFRAPNSRLGRRCSSFVIRAKLWENLAPIESRSTLKAESELRPSEFPAARTPLEGDAAVPAPEHGLKQFGRRGVRD